MQNGKERREAARLQNAAYGVQGAYGEERQAVSRVRETEKESKAVWYNQAERRQYFAAGEAATAGQANAKIAFEGLGTQSLCLLFRYSKLFIKFSKYFAILYLPYVVSSKGEVYAIPV